MCDPCPPHFQVHVILKTLTYQNGAGGRASAAQNSGKKKNWWKNLVRFCNVLLLGSCPCMEIERSLVAGQSCRSWWPAGGSLAPGLRRKGKLEKANRKLPRFWDMALLLDQRFCKHQIFVFLSTFSNPVHEYILYMYPEFLSFPLLCCGRLNPGPHRCKVYVLLA